MNLTDLYYKNNEEEKKDETPTNQLRLENDNRHHFFLGEENNLVATVPVSELSFAAHDTVSISLDNANDDYITPDLKLSLILSLSDIRSAFRILMGQAHPEFSQTLANNLIERIGDLMRTIEEA